MPYPTTYEPIATNKNDVTVQAGDHPDHHNTVARILNSVQQQLLGTGGASSVQFGPGSAALPSISFAADTNTGLWNRGADQIGFSTAGVNRWYIDAGGLLLAETDNSWDIGGVGVNRPRGVSVASAVTIGSGIANPTLTIAATANATLNLDNTSDTNRVIWFRKNGVVRWNMIVNGTESGGNSGAAFTIQNFDDAGAYLGNALGIIRATGLVTIPLLSPTTLAPTGNVIEQRNGISAQTLRIYNTYTDASNWERVALLWAGNQVQLQTELGGTGVARNLMIGTGGAANLYFRTTGTNRWNVTAAGHLEPLTDNAYNIGWLPSGRAASIYAGTSVVTPLLDTPLLTTAGNVIEQRNGTNGQALRIYNTYTDASNLERSDLAWTGNEFFIGTSKLGTGSVRNMRLSPAGGLRIIANGGTAAAWQFTAGGSLLTEVDNVADVGASGSNRPRNLYLAGAVSTGVKAGAAIDADVTSPTDGMIRLDSTNNRIYARVGGVWKFAALT
jgi:hypothetical protein